MELAYVSDAAKAGMSAKRRPYRELAARRNTATHERRQDRHDETYKSTVHLTKAYKGHQNNNTARAALLSAGEQNVTKLRRRSDAPIPVLISADFCLRSRVLAWNLEERIVLK